MSLNDLIIRARINTCDSEIQVEDFTCFNCGGWKTCPFSFDAYNTNGDCLAVK